MRYDKERHAEIKAAVETAEKEFFEIGAKIKDLSAQDGAYTEEEMSKHMALDKDHSRQGRELNALRDMLQGYEALKPVEKVAGEEHSMLRRFLAKGVNGLSEEEVKANINDDVGGQRRLRIVGLNSDTSQGSNAVPTVTSNDIVDRLRAYGGIQRMGRTFETDGSNNFRVPSADETAKTGSYQAQEATIAQNDVGNIGFVDYAAYTANSGIVQVSRESLDDIGFDVDAWLGRQVTTRIGRTESTAFTTGNGTAQPTGFVGNTTLGVTAAATNAVTLNEIVQLTYSVDAGYLSDVPAGPRASLIGQGRVGFLMSRGMEQALRELQDSDGRPLWQPDLTGGTPGTLLGYDYELSYELPGLATGNIPMYFGSWEHFGIRRVRGVEVYSFFDSNTVTTNSVHVVAFSRADSKFLGPMVSGNAESVKHLLMA